MEQHFGIDLIVVGRFVFCILYFVRNGKKVSGKTGRLKAPWAFLAAAEGRRRLSFRERRLGRGKQVKMNCTG